MHLCENTCRVKTHIGLMTVNDKVFEEASKITSLSRTTYCYKMTALNCNFIAQNRLNFISLIPITQVFVNIARWRISSISGKRILTFQLIKFIPFLNIYHLSPLITTIRIINANIKFILKTRSF